MAQLKQDLLSQQLSSWRKHEFTAIKELATQGITVPEDHFQLLQASTRPSDPASRAHCYNYKIKYQTPWPHWHVTSAVTLCKPHGWMAPGFLRKKWCCGLPFHLEVAEKHEDLWSSPALLTCAAKTKLTQVSHSPQQSPLLQWQETANIISETPPLMETFVVNNSRFFSWLSSFIPDITENT